MRALLALLFVALLATGPAWADTTPAAPVRTVAGKRPVAGDVPITAADVGALSCIGTCASWPTFLQQLGILIPTASDVDVRTSISDAPNGPDYVELQSGTIHSSSAAGSLSMFIQNRYGLTSGQMAALFVNAGAAAVAAGVITSFPPITTYLDTLVPAASTPTAITPGTTPFALTFYDVRLYRQPSDIDDAAAVNRAFAACSAGGGGYVWFPPQGSAYNIGSGIVTTGNGCTAKGVGIPNWPGTIGTKAQWTAAGSWVACNDTVNPCFDFHGSGGVEGLDFWWDQPAPSSTAGTAWTPTAYPWAVVFRQNFSHASGNQLADAYRGIDFEYTAASNIGGTYSYLDHNFVGAFKTGFRFASVNDTMYGANNHVRTIWNAGNSNMVTYQETNLVGMDINYIDNATFVATEIYNAAQAITFTDGAATYGTGTITAAAHNARFIGTQFNQDVQGVTLPTGTTHLVVDFEDTTAQSDTDTGRAAGYFFNLGSDNVDVGFHGLNVPNVGYSLFAVGGGFGGRLRVSDIHVGTGSSTSGYGYLGSGGHAFSLAQGATLDLPTGTQSIQGAPGSGAVTGCLAIGSCGSVLANTAASTPTAP